MDGSKHRRTMATVVGLAIAACLPLAGCGEDTSSIDPAAGGGTTVTDDATGPSQSDSSTTPPDAGETPTGGPTAPDAGSSTQPPGSGLTGPRTNDVAAAAVADLAARLSIAPDDITVTTNDEVTWRDGSLGCAKKGMAYITMLVAGHLVVLDAGGKTYEYHAAQGKAPFLCEDPQPPLPAGGAGS